VAYRYSFDKTYAGTGQFDRQQYEIVHEGLVALENEVRAWNTKALEHGAPYPPYERELRDLENMTSWGRERLPRPEISDFTIRRITVGSLRYIKAGLLLVLSRKEAELAAKASAKWPEGVVEAIGASLDRHRRLAAHMDVAPADILAEVTVSLGTESAADVPDWDVFVSHASEDKPFAVPLAAALRNRGLRVWLDISELTVGDSLRQSIDRGLARSRFGAVILSPTFFAKQWPQRELDGLAALEVNGRKVVLPVWLDIDAEGVRNYSPMLADRLATSADRGVEQVADDLVRAIQR